MMRLPRAELRRIRDHAHAIYPQECCGALVGRSLGGADAGGDDGFEKRVVRAVPLTNERADARDRRYVISSGVVREVEVDAARDQMELLGFYHSHPDHSAEPSRFDLEHAWPWYIYLILSVRGGVVGAPRGWRLAADRRGFLEDSVTIHEEEQ